MHLTSCQEGNGPKIEPEHDVKRVGLLSIFHFVLYNSSDSIKKQRKYQQHLSNAKHRRLTTMTSMMALSHTIKIDILSVCPLLGQCTYVFVEEESHSAHDKTHDNIL